MTFIQSKFLSFKIFLKQQLGKPFVFPVYQRSRRYLARNGLFILFRRSLLRHQYKDVFPRHTTRNGRSAPMAERRNQIPALLTDTNHAHPLTIGFIITENHPSTIYGDYFTAHGLGDEMEKYGYRVVYLAERPRYEWHLLASIDILVVMRHTFDPFLLRHYPGITSVAWIRGYVDEWCRAPWFHQYDIVLTTSELSLQYASRFTDPGKCLAVLKLAADTRIFRPGPCQTAYEYDISFVGNIFEVPRQFTRSLTVEPGLTFGIYGNMLDPQHPFRRYHRGTVSHADIPKIYNSSKIVLEDCTPMCRPWGCVNSRTFEAMACGACVVSNEVPGLKELFGDALLTYRDREDLRATVSWLLSHEEEREKIGTKARDKIVRRHTYRHRAKDFRNILFRYFETVPPEKPAR